MTDVEGQMRPANGGRPLILALSGGGFRGYYTSQVLARVEKLLNAQCCQIFDLISGTSIGGIVALALARGVSAEKITQTIREQGPKIFPRVRLVNARRTFGPPYKADHIRNAFESLLPDHSTEPLRTSSQRVIVVTVSPVTAKIIAVRSWDKGGTGEMLTIDAALATSAAPTYFPAHRAAIGPTQTLDLIDGGIAANAPDALAIHQAVTELGFSEERTAVFSVGTCGRNQGGISGVRPDASGLFGAMVRLGGTGIVNLMMAIQEERGVSEAIARVGAAQHLRIDEMPSDAQAKHLELNNASETSQRTLEALANSTGERLQKLGDNAVWRLMTARAQAAASPPALRHP
jgi:uncharacterized protein